MLNRLTICFQRYSKLLTNNAIPDIFTGLKFMVNFYLLSARLIYAFRIRSSSFFFGNNFFHRAEIHQTPVSIISFKQFRLNLHNRRMVKYQPNLFGHMQVEGQQIRLGKIARSIPFYPLCKPRIGAFDNYSQRFNFSF